MPRSTAGPKVKPKKPASQASVRHMTVDEIIKEFPEQWVVLAVTAHSGGWPSEGSVLAHSPDRAQAWALAEATGLDDLPGPVYVFDAIKHIRTGEEARAALKELEESPDALERIKWLH